MSLSGQKPSLVWGFPSRRKGQKYSMSQWYYSFYLQGVSCYIGHIVYAWYIVSWKLKSGLESQTDKSWFYEAHPIAPDIICFQLKILIIHKFSSLN